MGIEYMVLAATSCIVFVLMALSFLSLYLHIVEQTNKTPNIDVDLKVYQGYSYALISLIIRHKGGGTTDLQYLMITTDKGVIKLDFKDMSETLTNIFVELIGFEDNRTVLPGSTARVDIRIPINYFYNKTKYYCIIVFNETMVSSSFNF